MAYQIDQKLANGVYDAINSIEVGRDTDDLPILWTKAVLEKDADGNPTKYMEYSNSSTGYYGAVYTNNKGEYILANRGTEITRASDIHADINMWQGKVPAQLADAKKLMDQAASNGFTISEIVGHSLGGSLSQMLGVIYNIKTITYNAYNTREILDNAKTLTAEQRSEYSDKVAQLGRELAAMPASDPQLTIMRKNALDELASLESQLAEDSLAQAWQKNSSGSNIVNYRIVGDPVSSYLKEPQVGEDITILNANGNAENTTVMLEAMNANSLAGEIANLGFHFMDNFSIENLMSSGKDITLKDSLGTNSDALLELAEFFKDKTNFEIDQTGAGSIRVGQEHELFIGTTDRRSDWSSTGNTRSQLITSQGDSMYTKVNLAAVGTAAEIAAKSQQAIDFMLSQKYASGSPKYEIKHNEAHADKQTYILFQELPDNHKPQQYDPLAIDLDNSGKVETVGLSAGILFDHDADGVKTGTGWVASNDGLVVRDINNDGKITSGREIFGENTILANGQKAKDAFEAIADLDINKDGKVDVKDAAFSQLKVWQDKNQNGISEASELKTLTELGITSISTQASITGVQNSANGNVEIGFSSFERADGSKGSSGAFNFVGNPINSEFTDTIDTSLVMDIPNTSGSGKVRDLREVIEFVNLSA